MLCYDAQTGAYVWGFHVPNETRTLRDGTEQTLDAPATGVAVSGERLAAVTGAAIYAFDRRGGDVLWKRVFTEDAFNNTPVVADGRVHVGSIQQFIYGFDLESGETLWRKRTRGSIQVRPAVYDGRVYQINDGYGELWVLDAATGEVAWHTSPPGRDADFLSPAAAGEGYVVATGTKKIHGMTVPE